MRLFAIILGLFLFMGLFSACQSSKHYLKAHSDMNSKRKKVFDEHLLVKNKISSPKKKLNPKKNEPIVCSDSVLIYPQSYTIDADLTNEIYYDLSGMLRQKPNRVLLYGRPFLWVYNMSDTLRVKYRYDKNYRYEQKEGEWVQGAIRPDTLSIKKRIDDTTVIYKAGKLRKFFMVKVGEEPVVFDTIKTQLTARSMQNHLIQKGFLDAKVGYIVKYKKHKAEVSYHYSTGKPILIDTVIYDSEDPAMKRIMEELKDDALLKAGMPMNKAAFQKERTRLTSEIRNRGYYNFNWNYITYIADTANATKVPAVETKTLFGKKPSTIVGEQGEPRVQIYVSIASPSDTVRSHTNYNIHKVYVVLDEPKVEIHKIKRRFLMDTSYVALRPPRKKEEVAYMYNSQITEYDSLVYLRIHAAEGRNIIEELSKSKTKSLLVVPGGRYPYWIQLRKAKTAIAGIAPAVLEENEHHKINIIFSRKKKQSFVHAANVAGFVARNVSDSALYRVDIKPYRRRFVRQSYPNLAAIDEGDIPIHIILRKPAISILSDSLEKIKDEARLKKENFIIRDHAISQFVEIAAGDVYNYDAGRETINHISELEIFRFPRVEYVPSKSGNANELDAYVFMQKAKKQTFGGGTDFNTSNANLGWALNANYKNHNVFKGAESLIFNVEGGINFDPRPDSANQVKGIVQWIDLLDINSSLSLVFPKIVGFRNWSLSVNGPKSKISIAYHYLQQSTDFRVSAFDATFGYDWSLKKKTHVFSWTPFMLNFTLQPVLDPAFELRLQQTNYALWASLKERYFLPGTSFSYQYTPKKSDKHIWQLRFFAETVGNTAWLIDLLTQKQIAIFETAYSQYVKGDIDFRYTYKISKKQLLATRLMAGAAIPMGNTAQMPYSRQFFLGGPSSMRGWSMRELGPGKTRPATDALFQLGDMRLEMNAEYRFMLNSWIGSALFVDAGNIWMSKSTAQAQSIPYSTSETGVFNANFLQELAVDIGTGLRLDMSFFVIRIDLAVPVRNPAGFVRIDDNGFTHYVNEYGFPTYWKFDWRSTNFLLAVGYPF